MNLVVGKKYTCKDHEGVTYVVNYVGQYFIVATSVHDSEEESFNRQWAEENFTAVPETITVTGYLTPDGTAFLSEAELKKFTDAGLHPSRLGRKVNATFTYLEE